MPNQKEGVNQRPPVQHLICRRHPLSHPLPYALDLHTIGLHCLLPRLNGPITSYPALMRFLPVLETLTSPTAVKRELEVIRITYANARSVGPVYDLPTVPGWAIMQKIARTDLFLRALLGSTTSVYSVPKDLVNFDDIRPDTDALPEVSPYTQLAAILYEALDALLLTTKPSTDAHLRNLYPHAVWSSGVVYSQGQARRLAALAPPPRVFSRWLECPITGEILAVPGIVRRDGWLTLFQALVPTYLEGGVSFDKGGLERFVPRSSIAQKPVAASILIEQLTFAELYYLIIIEEVGSNGDMEAVLHETHMSENTSLGLVDQFLDKSAFCQSRDIRVERKVDLSFSQLDALWKSARDGNRALAYAEQAMCNALSTEAEVESVHDDPHVTFVYKQDARIDFPLLDGYDGWTDEELSRKKHKAWAPYMPPVLLPVEVNAMFVDRGIQLYCVCGGARILWTNRTASGSVNYDDDVFVRDGVTWTELRSLLEKRGPALRNCADRLVLSLLSAGNIRLYGYYYCADAAEGRHISRSLGVFMDAPLRVLGYKVPEREISFRENGRDCLIIPIGPACTMLMPHLTEKTSKVHGNVYHSEYVTVLPHGCRLGDRRHLQWYQVGAGLWETSEHPPHTLLEMAETALTNLSCTVSGERDHLLIKSQKGITSVRLRELGFQAGWTGFSPHLLITGKGKRITATVRAHCITHVIDVLRRIRDSKQLELQHSSIQEIAAMVVLKEVLIGALTVTGDHRCLGWSPSWKKEDGGFVIAHAISLPRGVGVRQVDTRDDHATDNSIGLLISRDTMAVFRECGQVGDVWKLSFVRFDANIESEKLLVSPNYEGFVLQVSAGKMGAS